MATPTRITSEDGFALLVDPAYISVAASQITYDLAGSIPPPIGDYVASFRARTGAVVPSNGDYDATQVTYFGLPDDPSVAAALDLALAGNSPVFPVEDPPVETSDFQAVVGVHHLVDATAANVVVLPPTGPTVNQRVALTAIAVGGNIVRWDADAAGQPMNGATGPLAVFDLNTAGQSATFVWAGATVGWVVL